VIATVAEPTKRIVVKHGPESLRQRLENRNCDRRRELANRAVSFEWLRSHRWNSGQRAGGTSMGGVKAEKSAEAIVLRELISAQAACRVAWS
jgi:hypothetical protein